MEDFFYCASRASFPFAIYRMGKMGAFEQSMSYGEARYVLRAFLIMHGINYAGHFLMKYYT